MSEDDKSNNLLSTKKFISIVVGVIFINCGIVIVFTQPYFQNLFRNTGTIGDTINGLTVPLFSLLGTYIIYMSFRQQMLINQNQAKNLEDEIKRTNAQSDFNTYYDIFKNVKNEFETWKYYSPRYGQDNFKSGKEALNRFYEDLMSESRNNNIQYLNTVDDINYFVETILTLVIKIRQFKTSDINGHSLLVTMLITFYSKKMDKELLDIRNQVNRIDINTMEGRLSIELLKENINHLNFEIAEARKDIVASRKNKK